MAQARAEGADLVECRLDYLDRPDPPAVQTLLAGRPLPVIVTCRPARQGGRFAGEESRRLALLSEAARLGAEYVDLELDALPAGADLVGLVRGGDSRTQVILSHHDLAGRPADLDEIVSRLEASGADVVKVAFAASGPEDALAALAVLRRCTKPAIALAMGECGAASRILAGKFGAFGTFAALEEGAESAPGQLTLQEMKRLYRWQAIGPGTRVYGVIGCPVAHSVSPAVHNAAFAAAGVDAVYVPLRIEPGAENFNRFLDALVNAPWADFGGLSVTIPHKENALARVGAGAVDELSRRIGAINTIRLEASGGLRGWNTDYAAAINALCSAMNIAREDLAARKVAVVGAGGAARAVVAALAHYRAEVAIHNRTASRAQRLAEEFGCSAAGLEELGRTSAQVLVNCTSVGMHPEVEQSPLERIPPAVKVVFDTVYNPAQTRLLRLAAAAGCRCVSGVEMFVNQAVAQFEIWTGRPAPREVMRQAVMDQLSGRKA
jgi:3-dehydroquinate dehydratase/shikimate dehydrogenase